ncbi:sugar nucleotide-binding protein [Sphingomonas aerolata]|uniref:NAD-dependent epimerase/dehydratase family protein n=1 Tax=Sphingomonas aerolata TaxID=185951 RepID=UPI002FE06916
MTIGLTGARGVLGRRLVEVLDARGTRVAPFDGDVRDAAALAEWATGCERIVHAAAIVPTIQVKEGTGTAIAVNVAGTANVATAAASAGVPLTYISTSHVYASSDSALPEDAPVHPVSLYGLTKWQGEQWVDQLAPAPWSYGCSAISTAVRLRAFWCPRSIGGSAKRPKGLSYPCMAMAASVTWRTRAGCQNGSPI